MLAKKLHVDQNKEFTTNLRHLELAGFIARDYYYKPDGTISKFSHFRIKDNYTRFYLKHIFPLKDKVQNSGKIYKTLSEIKGIDSLYGLQFENLILANRHLLNSHLNLEDREILSSSPYRQYKTLANKGGCQIDLLISASFNSFFLCEFKCKKWIEKSIIQEVEKKSKIISLPKKSTIRPVLVYEGEIYPPDFDELKNYFYRIISFEQLLMHA